MIAVLNIAKNCSATTPVAAAEYAWFIEMPL